MSEHSLWQWLSDSRRPILPVGGHYTRIESETSAGFPDVHYTLAEVSGTIELKFVRHQKKEYPLRGKGNGFRDSQIRWIKDEFIAGGWVLLIVEIHKVVAVFHPRLVSFINDYTQEELAKYASVSINKLDPTAEQVRRLKNFMLRRL